MTDPLVLVLGIQEEWAAVEVGKELDARGVRWIPLNVADFPLTMTIGAALTPDADRWCGSVRSAEHELPLHEVTAVFYGRPTDFVMPPGLSAPELRFSRAQARMGLGGVLASIPARWVSHPSALADAAYKPWQLTLLKRAGLAVPPTLITNDADAVRGFAAAFGDLIVKPLAESVVYESSGEALVYTRRIAADELDAPDGVEVTAHLFQQWQPKQFEARVTAVGDRLFPVAIHASSEKAQVESRRTHSPSGGRAPDDSSGRYTARLSLCSNGGSATVPCCSARWTVPCPPPSSPISHQRKAPRSSARCGPCPAKATPTSSSSPAPQPGLSAHRHPGRSVPIGWSYRGLVHGERLRGAGHGQDQLGILAAGGRLFPIRPLGHRERHFRMFVRHTFPSDTAHDCADAVMPSDSVTTAKDPVQSCRLGTPGLADPCPREGCGTSTRDVPGSTGC